MDAQLLPSAGTTEFRRHLDFPDCSIPTILRQFPYLPAALSSDVTQNDEKHLDGKLNIREMLINVFKLTFGTLSEFVKQISNI